jgi:hypothetical protein
MEEEYDEIEESESE